MRPYSLTFYSDDHEQKYQEQNMKVNLKSYQRNFIFYASLSIILTVYSFFDDMWLIGVLGLVFAISIPIMYLVGRRGPKSFDFTCFVFQFSQNIISPICYMVGINKGIIFDCQSYLVGQGVTYLVQSSNLGSRFYLKVATIILNFLVEMYIKLLVQKEISFLTFFFIGTNFMVVNYIYRQDRIQREAFLLKTNETLWQQEVGKCSQISTIRCISEKGHLILDFENCNATLLEEFEITSMDSYKLFLNNVKLIEKKSFSIRAFNNMKYQQKSNKILSLHAWISRYSEQTQRENCEFIGSFNSILYDVQIFTTWNDQQLIIHTLMTQSKLKIKGDNSSIIQYERQLFSIFRNKISKQIKTIFVYLKQTKYPQNNGRVMSLVYDALRINYNYQLYANPQYELSYNHFLLSPLVKEINEVMQDFTPKPFNLNFQFLVDPNLKLYSCRKTILHIIFNLYSIIVPSAKQSGYIKLSIQQKLTLIGQYITICIGTDVTSIKSMTDAQNHHRSNYGRDNQFKIDDKKIGLEIVVSEFLVGKLGPKRRIKMNQCQYPAHSIIQFTIYQDLSVLNI